jgi:hypothetical protein
MNEIVTTTSALPGLWSQLLGVALFVLVLLVISGFWTTAFPGWRRHREVAALDAELDALQGQATLEAYLRCLRIERAARGTVEA